MALFLRKNNKKQTTQHQRRKKEKKKANPRELFSSTKRSEKLNEVRRKEKTTSSSIFSIIHIFGAPSHVFPLQWRHHTRWIFLFWYFLFSLMETNNATIFSQCKSPWKLHVQKLKQEEKHTYRQRKRKEKFNAARKKIT